MRLVTLSPSRPAIGESFTAKRIDRVGGSIGCALIGVGNRKIGDGVRHSRGGQARDRNDVARLGFSTGTRSSPRNAMILDARPCSTTLPSLSSAWIG
jgi:hypothetical protein